MQDNPPSSSDESLDGFTKHSCHRAGASRTQRCMKGRRLERGKTNMSGQAWLDLGTVNPRLSGGNDGNDD
eukprot:5086626-Heterocapsa_arctica.AAC.1